MPNRILRDWTDSEKMSGITSQAERFFTRLIMKADDFGCFHANPKLLKAALFPLNDDIKDLDIARWLNECAKVELVQVYKVNGKMYLQIVDFGQRLRQSRAKFPQPQEADVLDSNFPQVPATSRDFPPESESESEVETETETETETEGAREESRLTVWPTFDDFWNAYDKKVDRAKCEKKWKKINQGAREKIMEHLRYYVDSTPDPQYRKNPATYLTNQSWENEIIPPKNVTTKNDRSDFLNNELDIIANHAAKTG
jgi:hypothetical protein